MLRNSFLQFSLFLGLTLFSNSSFAAFLTTFEIEPFGFYSMGKFENKTLGDKGTLNALGYGARVGFGFSYLSINLEGRMSTPQMKESAATGQDRGVNPLVHKQWTSLGANAQLRLGYFRLHYSYFPYERLEGKANDLTLGPTGTYTYIGTGESYGVSLNLYSGFQLGLFRGVQKFDHYALKPGIQTAAGPLAETKNSTRSLLTTESLIFSASYSLSF